MKERVRSTLAKLENNQMNSDRVLKLGENVTETSLGT